MLKKAFLFPGQGSQFVGMGRDLYDNFKEARLVFEEVDDALGMHLSKIIFEGPEVELGMTENTQPAIMAVSVASYLTEERGGGAPIFAGHSLGEYSALVAAGVLSISDAARLLKIRGRAMQESCHSIDSAMAALLGMEIEEVRELILKIVDHKYICEVANHNSREQIVISGHAAGVEQMIEYFKSIGKRAVKLKVSAPFHSSLITEAEERMREALEGVKFHETNCNIISNVTADFYKNTNEMKELLAKQVTSTVRWYEIMQLLVHSGVSEVQEFGPGDVLKNLFKRHN
jgi:[acyl-carrier-protein] S-malonyltransferase